MLCHLNANITVNAGGVWAAIENTALLHDLMCTSLHKRYKLSFTQSLLCKDRVGYRK